MKEDQKMKRIGTIKSVDNDGKVLEVVHEGRPEDEEEEDDY